MTESAPMTIPVMGPGDRLELLAGIGVSEHWNSLTVHVTVALGLTVQLFVTKVHFIALGFAESKTQPERVIVTMDVEYPPTRKSTELPRNTLAKQVHETIAQRRPGKKLSLMHELLTKSRWERMEERPDRPTNKQLRFPFDLNEQNSIETPQSV
jgi:hypothetical protein